MIYLNRFLLLAVVGAALAVSLPGISKADDPKKTSIYGSIRLPRRRRPGGGSGQAGNNTRSDSDQYCGEQSERYGATGGIAKNKGGCRQRLDSAN